MGQPKRSVRAVFVALSIVGIVMSGGCGGASTGEESTQAAGDHDHSDHEHSDARGLDIVEGTGPPAAVTAAVAESCVAPGEAQRLSVDAQPGDSVRYVLTYAGESDGGDAGVGRGTTGGDGTFTSEWTVPNTTPEGHAVVAVFVTDASGTQRGSAHATFMVASREICNSDP